jgi:hypothetical protein
MKKLLPALLVFILLPALSYSHPGKTNRYGGHKCLKGCEEWGLFYDEYHLHDKDGKPIRVGKMKKVKRPGNAELASRDTTTAAAQEAVMSDATKTVVVTNYRYVTNVYEENLIQSNPLIYLLLTLLLLLLILLMNRRKKEN